MRVFKNGKPLKHEYVTFLDHYNGNNLNSYRMCSTQHPGKEKTSTRPKVKNYSNFVTFSLLYSKLTNKPLTHCRLNEFPHTIYWKSPISVLVMSGRSARFENHPFRVSRLQWCKALITTAADNIFILILLASG